MKAFLRKPEKRWLHGVTGIGIMALIFFFSAQSGPASSATSGRWVKLILQIIKPDYGKLSAAEQSRLFMLGQGIIRKGAHFLIYACLSANACLFIRTFSLRHPALYAFFLTALYACTDELHQLFISERSGTIADVLLDCCGAAAGLSITLTLCQLHAKKKQMRIASSPGGNES